MLACHADAADVLLSAQIEKARKQPSLLPPIRKELGRYGHMVALLRSCNNYMTEALQSMNQPKYSEIELRDKDAKQLRRMCEEDTEIEQRDIDYAFNVDDGDDTEEARKQAFSQLLLGVRRTLVPLALRNPWDITGKELLKCLPHEEWRETLLFRLQNLNDSLDVCSADLEQCTAMTDTIDTLRIHKQLGRIGTYTHICAEASKYDYRNAGSILIMGLMISSTFAWRFMDRVSGADLKQMEWGPNHGYGHRFYSAAPEDCSRPSPTDGGEANAGATGATMDSLSHVDVDMSTVDPCEEGQLDSSVSQLNAARWQADVVAGLSARPGVLAAVSLLWAAVFFLIMLWTVRYRSGDDDKMLRLQAKLDIPISKPRHLGNFLQQKRIISSRVMDVSGRTMKMVEWQEHDRHGEETAGWFGEHVKRLKMFLSWVLDCIGVDARCRRRNTMAVAPEGGHLEGENDQDLAADNKEADGLKVLMAVRRHAKKLVKAGRRRIGWAGLPPRIELIIDRDAAQFRSVVFTVDSSSRPDLTEIEMVPMLCRLLTQHLEYAGCVEEGTAIKLWPRPTTPGGTLMEGRG